MNLIITAATGYPTAKLVPFLDSVERNCDQARVIMIVYQKDRQIVHDLQKKYPFLEFITVPRKPNPLVKAFRIINARLAKGHYLSKNRFLKSLSRYFLHIALERYFLALKVIRDYGGLVSNVLLTDSRDVLIQQNPFSLIDEKLVSGTEADRMTIKGCPINSAWIRALYGEKALKAIGDNRIVCSGVTMGPAQAVEEYLVEMCQEIIDHLPNAASLDGMDQGMHNYLISTDRVMIETVDNRSGIIATLGYEDPSAISQDGETGLIAVYENYPAILHQYDRHPGLAVD